MIENHFFHIGNIRYDIGKTDGKLISPPPPPSLRPVKHEMTDVVSVWCAWYQFCSLTKLINHRKIKFEYSVMHTCIVKILHYSHE